ncbi:MAG: PAS domain S-box protein [Kiritimatiellae bacterium]|nr:PAS domain S-box protein [Kiritimatiellia bacterium]MCO5068712.1 PAS domain S-box protein [Kiritimatiellia bacterium]
MPKPAPKSPRKRTLSELHARLQTIINTVVDGIITIDDRGIIESVNPATERIFGHKAGSLIGQNVKILMPPPWTDEHDGYIKRYRNTGTRHIIGTGREVRGLRKDGTTFPMYLAVNEMWIDGHRFFTGIVRDITDRKRVEQAIAQASEEERRQLGQELHDGLGQQLTGITLLAKALQGRLIKTEHPAQAEAGEIVALLGRALGDMRRQAHGLYPVELERNGLPFAIEELAVTYRDRYGISCLFTQQGKLPAMDKRAALHIYRIIQEATHNAVRHGHAKQICIRLERSANVLKIEVEDNGRGIRLRKLMPGMGITIMRYRASVLAGQLEIQRIKEGGTLVRVTCRVQSTLRRIL